ncbi:hypothetical protein [Leucobacter denitrificans]|uniref:Uncharacterized protein n=1 Tax=Leucobacter denitrificans TaxID=683042 RepID=A0A7G9S4C0_9MICO|nr:hypothetical protein [Leucobacter denitrificans]QNN62695.1 hypothetical protein H9L06_10805 [Leucobacter denitrificans]
MTDTKQRERTVVAAVTRWFLIVHAALLIAQPILAGAMLDAMSPAPQQMHRMVAMTLTGVGLVQILMTWWAWKGKSQWPKAAFTGSIALSALELGQFTLGHLSLGMSVHLPLGVLVLVIGVYLAFKHARL